MTLRPNISRYLQIAGALTVLGALCVVLVIYLLTSLYKDDGIVTAKQCTDTDTAASMDRLEEGGVIKEDFTQTPVTEELCSEINDRALLVGTNPVARAIEVERVVQEFRIIQDSMRAADENQLASRRSDSSPAYGNLAAGSPPGRIAISPLSFSLAQGGCANYSPSPSPSPPPAPEEPPQEDPPQEDPPPPPPPDSTTGGDTTGGDTTGEDTTGGSTTGGGTTDGSTGPSPSPPPSPDSTTGGSTTDGSTTGSPETVKMLPLSFSMAQNNCGGSSGDDSSGGSPGAGRYSGEVDSSGAGSKSAKTPIDSPSTPSISSDARKAVKDGASPKEAVAEAQAAGESAGASKVAAAAGAKNAVSLALIDGTMTNGVVKGNVAYTTPPQEMRWNDSTDMELVLSPSTSNSIEELKQNIKEVKEAGEVKVEPVDVSQRMEAVVFSTPDPAFDVSSITGESQQPIISEGDTKWRWKIIASNTGDKDLYLNLSVGLSSPQEGESFSFRPAEGFPVSFEKISVKGTPWQNGSNFVGSNWQWLWTAILVPLVVFLRGRRRQSSKSEDKGFIGNSSQWLRTTIIVPVAAFLQEKRRQSNKNRTPKKDQQRATNTNATKVNQKSLPVADYDDLTVEEAKERCDELSEGELRKIRSYEKKHKNRKTLVRWLDRRDAK